MDCVDWKYSSNNKCVKYTTLLIAQNVIKNISYIIRFTSIPKVFLKFCDAVWQIS